MSNTSIVTSASTLSDFVMTDPPRKWGWCMGIESLRLDEEGCCNVRFKPYINKEEETDWQVKQFTLALAEFVKNYGRNE